jgi:hypothetical protein
VQTLVLFRLNNISLICGAVVLAEFQEKIYQGNVTLFFETIIPLHLPSIFFRKGNAGETEILRPSKPTPFAF